MGGFRIDFEADNTFKKQYKTFVSQFNDWFSNGTMPGIAAQDVRTTLELQRRHWKTLGLDVQCQLRRAKNAANSDIASVSYQDKIFVNQIGGNTKQFITTIRKDNREIYKQTTDATVSAVIQNPKQNVQPPADTPMTCPHCGAPSTLAGLEHGCSYCDTSFVMDELYPKVVNFFITRDRRKTQKDHIREALLFMAVGSVALLPAMKFLYAGKNLSMASMVSSMVMAGAILGFMLWIVWRLFSVFAMMGKDMRGAGKLGKTLHFRNRIKKIDPMFSSEYFRDRAMHLFQMVAFSEDPGIYTACECKRPETWKPVIDANLYNFGVDHFTIKGQECEASLTLYMDCLLYQNGKIKPASKKYRMRVRKTITEPTNLGFTVKAVSCPSCGASFDAEQVKCCPFCGNDYDLSRHDWVVTDLQ